MAASLSNSWLRHHAHKLESTQEGEDEQMRLAIWTMQRGASCKGATGQIGTGLMGDQEQEMNREQSGEQSEEQSGYGAEDDDTRSEE